MREGSVYGIMLPKDTQSTPPAPGTGNVAATARTPAVPHLMVPFVALASLGITLFAGVLYLLWRPDWPVSSDSQYNGLGGWLILVAFNLISTPLFQLNTFAENLKFLNPEVWAQVAAEDGSLYHPLWPGLILAEIAFNIGTLVMCVVLLVLFFRKWRTFPLLYLIVQIVTMVGIVADTVLVSYLATQFSGLIKPPPSVACGAVVRVLIWVPYMLTSRRVRATFVRGGPRLRG